MPSSQEKVLAYYMSRLRDKRPDVQLEAIHGLEAMGAEAETALPALRECYEQVEDSTVKNAAQQAGYKIFMAVKENKK